MTGGNVVVVVTRNRSTARSTTFIFQNSNRHLHVAIGALPLAKHAGLDKVPPSRVLPQGTRMTC